MVTATGSVRYLLDDLGHVLCALVLQPGQLEQLCNPPDADDVVLVQDLGQGPAAEALEPRQQVHVCHTQHVVGVLWGQLTVHRGVTALFHAVSPTQLPHRSLKCSREFLMLQGNPTS